MTTTREYRSTDPGMPALSGQAGKLIDILDAVLDNGGTTQSVTSITRSGATATATKTAHGLRTGCRVIVAGANETEYNVSDVAVTVVDANSFTFPVSGTPATPATGSITVKIAPAGWTKEFSGTNKAVYRAPQGRRFYLRVLDDGSDATNAAKVATMRGYVSMSDVDTGTEPFPTVAQRASGVFVGKSTSADATARGWAIYVDEKRLVLLTAYSSSVTNAYAHYIFGDLVDAPADDAYAAVIYGATATADAVASVTGSVTAYGNLTFNTASASLFAPRGPSGAGTAVQLGHLFANASGGGSGYASFTAGPDASGNVWADPIQALVGTNVSLDAPRGRIPGIYYLRHYLPYATFPSFYEFGNFRVIRFGSSHGQAYLIDAGDWE